MNTTHQTEQCCPKFPLTALLLREKIPGGAVNDLLSEARAILTILLDLSTIRVEDRLSDDADVHSAIMLAASLLEASESIFGKEFK